LPTVFTVSDVGKLKNQAFFQNAQNGDRVLVYANQKEAILYSPKRNLVVAVGPVSLPTPQVSSAPGVKIGLRNGTNTVGLTSKVETFLQQTFPDSTIAFREQDKKTDYQNTVVVALVDSSRDAAARVAKALHASVADLPAGEEKPTNANILVIVGKDYASQ